MPATARVGVATLGRPTPIRPINFAATVPDEGHCRSVRSKGRLVDMKPIDLQLEKPECERHFCGVVKKSKQGSAWPSSELASALIDTVWSRLTVSIKIAAVTGFGITCYDGGFLKRRARDSRKAFS